MRRRPAPAAGHRPAYGPVLPALCLLAALLVVGASPAEAKPDPRWRFYTSDTTRYTSPWFSGARRVMVPYGCTRAPYYDHDPRCAGRRGFHHGVDVAIPCGRPIYAGRGGRVLSRRAPGTPGPAYGVHPLRIRSGRVDLLIGHARRVYVRAGQRVRKGQLIARVSDSGAPDGCHLHFEVRRHGTGYRGAIDPARWLRLTPRG